MQELWIHGSDWDEKLPKELRTNKNNATVCRIGVIANRQSIEMSPA